MSHLIIFECTKNIITSHLNEILNLIPNEIWFNSFSMRYIFISVIKVVNSIKPLKRISIFWVDLGLRWSVKVKMYLLFLNDLNWNYKFNVEPVCLIIVANRFADIYFLKFVELILNIFKLLNSGIL